MNKLFNLEIYTPERTFFEGQVESLVINTHSGEIGILYHTLPLVTTLQSGVMRILQNGKWMEAANSVGFVEVTRDMVTVLTDSAAWPHEVDINAVNEEIDELDERKRKAKSLEEYKMAKAQLAIQFAKLKITHQED